MTEAIVKRAPKPQSGQAFVRDDKVTGLALRVTAGGAKAFVFEWQSKGQSHRVTIGRWPAMTLSSARRHAMELRTTIEEQRAMELRAAIADGRYLSRPRREGTR